MADRQRPATSTRQGPDAPRRKGGVPVFWIAVGVVVLIGIVAVVFTLLEDRGEAIEVADVGIAGESLPRYDGQSPDPAVGMVAPQVAGVTFDGEDIVIEVREGRPLAIVVLAHWCPHCQYEVTQVTRWLDETGGVEGVDLAAVSTRVEPLQPNYPPSRWLSSEGWPVPTLVDDGEASVASALGMSGTPYWVFVDGEGRVVLRAAGRIEVDVLERILTDLAAG